MSDTSEPSVEEKIHERFPPQAGVEAVCLKSTPLPVERQLTYLYYVDKTSLSDFSHVFADMLTVGESTAGQPDVVQLSEDSGTITLLLDCMSEDLPGLPDLSRVCQGGIIRLHAAAFKYGVIHAQHMTEQNIRARLDPRVDAIAQIANLATLFRHALDFSRSELLVDVAAAIARQVSKPDEPFFSNLLQSVSTQGVNALLKAYSDHQREKEAILVEDIDSWIRVLGNRNENADIRQMRQTLSEMNETVREIAPSRGGRPKKRRFMKSRTARKRESCDCCRIPGASWGAEDDAWNDNNNDSWNGHQYLSWGNSNQLV